MPLAYVERFKLIDYPSYGDGITSALVDSDNYLIMSGDSHNDKIDIQIEGFFRGLEFANVSYTIEGIVKDGVDINDDFHEEGIYKG